MQLAVTKRKPADKCTIRPATVRVTIDELHSEGSVETEDIVAMSLFTQYFVGLNFIVKYLILNC